MTKKAQPSTQKPTQTKNENVIGLEQKMQIELIEHEIQEMVIELNTLPRVAISAFLIPFMTSFLFQDFFSEWESWMSKLFIKLQLLSDEMDPFILNMTTDYLQAKNVMESFSRGEISPTLVIEQINTFCQQITQSQLLKKLNFNLERVARFTSECRLDFVSMPAQELQQHYKTISDKYRVVQSITVEDLLNIANKQHFFSSFLGVMFYQLIAKNTIDPFFNSIIRYPVLYPMTPSLDNNLKINLNYDTAKTYLEKLVRQKNNLSQHHYYQQIFFRLLILSLLVLYLLFGVGQTQMGILFFGVINIAFSGLWREIKTHYQQYSSKKTDHKKQVVLTNLFNGINCHIEKKIAEKSEKMYFLIRFAPKQKVSEGQYPIANHHIIRQLIKLFRTHQIKALYDKKNTIAIDGNFSVSDTKFRLIHEQIKACIKRCSDLNDGIKKIKLLIRGMHEFGVDDSCFIEEAIKDITVIKINVSLSLPDTAGKMQELIMLLTGQQLNFYYCYNQACIGEFVLDEAILQAHYLLAREFKCEVQFDE
ncbi:MAG: hypothetical protein HKM04_01315 [Legionellales bacterium]|nr:hypothetical protein [Legionellales bacterium]